MVKSGVPDYGMYAALENMGNLVDYGELAARLGSVVTFNREGNVVFWDDFESTPLKWDVFFEGGSGSLSLSPEAAVSGGQCVKAITYPATHVKAGISRYFLLLAEGNVGSEFAFSTEDTNQFIYVHNAYDDGQYIYNAIIRLNVSEQTLEVRDEHLGWVTIATGIEILLNKRLFHILKVVVNNQTKKYIRVIIDREEYNISQYDLSIYQYTEGKATRVKIHNKNIEAVEKTLYIDNFILTQNEP